MYIDEYLLFNFIIDYLILKTLISILKINTKKIYIIISCLIGEISIISLFVNMNEYIFILFKFLLAVLMIYIIDRNNNIKTIIRNLFYYFIISFFLGGTLYYLKNESVIKYKFILLLTPIIMNIYEYFTYNLKSILNLNYKVTIYLNNGKILYLNGKLDTANTLIEPYTNKKVIIINYKLIKNENFYLVPYTTINSSSLLKCFNPKKVYIDGIGERKDISIGVTKEKFNGFNCLLNYRIMEDL